MQMTYEEMYEYLVKELGSPEVALKKLLMSSVDQYHTLQGLIGDPGQPIMIVAAVAKELGWRIALERNEDDFSEIRGISIGTQEYLDSLEPKEGE